MRSLTSDGPGGMGTTSVGALAPPSVLHGSDSMNVGCSDAPGALCAEGPGRCGAGAVAATDGAGGGVGNWVMGLVNGVGRVWPVPPDSAGDGAAGEVVAVGE